MNFSKLMTYFEINGMVENRSCITRFANDTGKTHETWCVTIRPRVFSSTHAVVIYKVTGTRMALLHSDIVFSGMNYTHLDDVPDIMFISGASVSRLSSEFCE